MSGYALCFGHCLTCNQKFLFNPMRVPSIRVKGIREPVCRNCIDLANAERQKIGKPPLEVHPEAYEACREEELG